MQNFGNRRSVQKCAQNAGSNVLKPCVMQHADNFASDLQLQLLCLNLLHSCGFQSKQQ